MMSGAAGGHRVDAVGDIAGGAAVGVLKILLCAVIEDDDLVGEPDAGLFARVDIPRAEGAFPFVPCPVQTVDGQDDPLAGEAGEPGEHGRPFGVDVDHVIGAERRRKTAEEAGRHRRKALAVDGGHPLEPDATVFVEVLDVVFFSADVMAGAVVAGDAVAVHHHPRGKLLYNDLDPSFP